MMKINYFNKYDIDNKIYIHDSIFEGFTYKENDKLLFIELKNNFLNKVFKLHFHNVISIKCEMCQFWGKSYRVLNWEISNDEPLIKEIIRKQNKDKELYNIQLINLKNSYIESKIILASGDSISIVCEYIEFEELTLE